MFNFKNNSNIFGESQRRKQSSDQQNNFTAMPAQRAS